jgi:acyl carrier protein
MNEELVQFTRSEIREWMIAYLARLLDLERHEIDPAQPFELYGLDSSGAVGMSGDLEDVLGAQFDTSLVYDHPTIDALVEHLVSLRLVRAA